MESIVWLLGVIIASLIGEEVLGISYRLSRLVIRQAAKNVPQASRERFVEETLAELADIRGPLSRMWNAIDYFWITKHIQREEAAVPIDSSTRKYEDVPLISNTALESNERRGMSLEVVERLLAASIILMLLILLIILAWPVPTTQ